MHSQTKEQHHKQFPLLSLKYRQKHLQSSIIYDKISFSENVYFTKW